MSRPAHFYKFCTARVAKLNLSTQRLRCSSPLRFNDPFDCYFPPGFTNLRRTVAALEKRHQEILAGNEVLPEGSRAAFNLAPLIHLRREMSPEVIARSRKSHKANVLAVATHFNREWQLDWERNLRCLRLLCLCEEGTDPLSWSHYADSHCGVAFAFDSSFIAGMPFVIAKPVKYRKRAPRAYSRKQFTDSVLGLAHLPNATRTLIPLVMTKSVEWSYEKEWRVVGAASPEERGLFSDMPFYPRSLSKIFLGCRISPRNKKAIERLATEDFAHVEIYLAKQSRSKFALQFERIR